MDDTFSDDGWDDLNDDTLQALENNAIQLTQAQKAGTQPQLAQYAAPQDAQSQESAYDYGFEDDDLDDADVIDKLAQQPARPPLPPPQPPIQNRVVPTLAGQQRWNHQQQQQQRATAAGPGYPPRSQCPTPARAIPPPVPSFRGAGPSRPLPAARPQPSQFARPPQPSARPYPPVSQIPGAPHDDILKALQVQVSSLERELMSAKGEAGILRMNLDKFKNDHEAELARLKKLNAEQLQKHERAVEAAVAAQRTAATELEFTRRDLKDELSHRGVNGNKKKKDGATTPRKNRSFVADGFDDLEILPMASPGRAAGGGQKRRDAGGVAVAVGERTPTKGKRKRMMVESPVNALEIQSDDVDVVMLDGNPNEPPKQIGSRFSGFRAHALPYDFLKLVLDHSPHHGQPLTFELFSRYAFPSAPTQSFASIIFEKLPQMGTPDDPWRLLVDFVELVLDMWLKCLHEKYHTPIYDLAALVLFTLQLNTLDVAPHIISSLVNVAQNTVYLLAAPRVQMQGLEVDITAHPDPVVRRLSADIDPTQSLSLLYLAALGCLSPPSSYPPGENPQAAFWSFIQPEFVLVMLNPKQPPADLLAMLSLLRTSALPTSIGPIPPAYDPDPDNDLPQYKIDLRNPEGIACAVLDRVTCHFAEPPRWISSPVPGTTTARECRFRMQALRTLLVFATSAFGRAQMKLWPQPVPRLVNVLSWAIDRLYDMDVPESIWEDDGKEDDMGVSKTFVNEEDGMDVDDTTTLVGQGDTSGTFRAADRLFPSSEDDDDDLESPTPHLHALIAQTVRLLHLLVTESTTEEDQFNMSAKLLPTPGGSQRYQLALARLSFAEEDGILEAGLDADTVELAHELLELAVTQEEGDAVQLLFGAAE